jgi:hypothetical protein
MTEEEQKLRDDIEDRFILLTTLSLVRDYLETKNEAEAGQPAKHQSAQQTAPVKPKAEPPIADANALKK